MPETLSFYALAGLTVVASMLVIGQRNPMQCCCHRLARALSGQIPLDAPFVASRRSSSTPGHHGFLFVDAPERAEGDAPSDLSHCCGLEWRDGEPCWPGC
jgi:hypothetical protein